MLGNKKSIFLVTMLMLILALSVGCSDSSTTDVSENGDVIAVVNGVEIYLDEFNKNFALIEKNYNELYGEMIWTQEVAGKTVDEIVKEEIANMLVMDELIVTYAKENGAVIDEAEVDEAYDNYIEVVSGDEAVLAFNEEHGIDEAFIKDQIRNQMYVEAFTEIVKDDIRKDTEQLEALYETYPVQVSASHILVEDQATAALVYEKISAGEDFAELATQYSQDPGSAANGGSLGYFPRGVMVKEFEDVAFALEIGEVSGIVESKFGFHIIKCDDILTVNGMIESGASEEEVEANKEKIIDDLANQAYIDTITQLKEEAEIQLYPEKYMN